MKKKLLALFLALTMVLALAACGGNSGGNGGGNSQNAGGDTAGTNEPAPSGDKIDISVIASQYGQNTTQWP